jgi:hypothetical protein
VCADGVALVRAALVTLSDSPAHLLLDWVALTCPACASVGPLLPLTAVPLRSNCETVAFFLWPANRPFVGCLLRLDAQPVLLLLAGSDSCPAARLLPRLAFRNSPSGATGFGAGAAAAAVDHEAEAAWCCGTGGGAGGTSHGQ